MKFHTVKSDYYEYLQLSRNKYSMCENVYVRNAIHFVVEGKQQKISDFVRQVIHEKGLSYRRVAEKSGGLITHSTVSDVINERVTNLSVETIIGLAKGLGVSEQEIFDIVRGKPADLTKIANERFASISEGYANLPEQERKNLEPLLTAIELTIGQKIPKTPTKKGRQTVALNNRKEIGDKKKRAG